MKEHLLKCANFNLWANKRITDKLNDIDPDLWLKEQKSSFRTIRETLLHIYDAETIWYKRLNGESLKDFPGKDYKGTNEEVIEILLNVSNDFIELVKNNSDEYFSSSCNFRSLDGTEYNTKVSDIVQHCMNHSTFHRGQIVTMLRFCGIDELPSTDYITYIRQIED